jgi:Ca2+-binding RTX toxin-like protein
MLRMRTLLVASLFLSALGTAAPAHSAVTCAFGAGTATVSMSAAGDSASIAVGTGANAGRIMVGVTACGAATTALTDTIVVNGNTGAENVTIDLSGGQFAPGVAVEGSGTSEIEFVVDLSTGVLDRVTVTGSTSADALAWGASGINLNADDDVDVTLANVELGTVNGSDGDDVVSGAGDAVTGAPTVLALTLNGDAADDVLTGGDGDDTISGGAGADAIAGGDGDDTPTGGAGNDFFDEGAAANGSEAIGGGSGNDLVTYGSRAAGVVVTMDGVFDDGEAGESDSVGTDVENAIGGAGDDVMTGSASANDLTGGIGIDVLDGGAGDDALSGGLGADRLTGGTGADGVFGDEGDDTILEGAGNDDLDGGADVDTLDYSGVTGAVALTLAVATPQPTGGAGTDTVTGFENLTGGSGADVLGGDAGANVLAGGPGNDTADYSLSTLGVTVDLSVEGPQDTGTAGLDTLVDLENATGGSGDDTITGDAGANALNGNDGDDTLAGLRGNDTLDGGSGADTLDYSAADAGIALNLASLAAQNTGGAGTDTVANSENVLGSSFADVLAGTVGANSLDGGGGTDTADYSSSSLGVTVDLSVAGPQDTVNAGVDTLAAFESLTGGSGRDSLAGNAGANVLTGGAGNDTLVASAGGDSLDGGTGVDTADYSVRPPRVVVNLTVGTATSSGSSDVLSAVENVTGSSGADVLTGDGGANVLTGGGGNDRLRGQAGADTLAGGAGTDTADYAGFFPTNGRIGVVVNLGTGEAVGDGADSLTGIENVRGSRFNDRLVGSSRANSLQGLDGADFISGAAGRDVLGGGDGADTFQARDRTRDRVYGGPGRDRARVDRRDFVSSIAVLTR